MIYVQLRVAYDGVARDGAAAEFHGGSASVVEPQAAQYHFQTRARGRHVRIHGGDLGDLQIERNRKRRGGRAAARRGIAESDRRRTRTRIECVELGSVE